MIKHIVMWKLKPEDKKNNLQAFKRILQGMRGKVDGLICLEVGIDYSATSASSDLVLYSEFETKQSLEDYLNHPDHQLIKQKAAPWIEQRHAVDYEC